jgi:hypothetical protein
MYGKKTALRRFQRALRAAFETPPMPMKDMPPKRLKAQRKPAAKKIDD